MTAAAPTECSRVRRAFSLAIGGYLVAWAAASCFLYRVFGCSGYANSMMLSLILAVPALVAVRMRFRRRATRPREFTFLAVLLIFVLAGSGYAVSYWYEKGFDRNHAVEVRFDDFSAIVQRDPAFSRVDVHVPKRGYKDSYRVSGTVPSETDLIRLKSLARQYDLLWCVEKIELATGVRRESQR
jgi:hypothetical protein